MQHSNFQSNLARKEAKIFTQTILEKLLKPPNSPQPPKSEEMWKKDAPNPLDKRLHHPLPPVLGPNAKVDVVEVGVAWPQLDNSFCSSATVCFKLRDSFFMACFDSYFVKSSHLSILLCLRQCLIMSTLSK